MGCIFCKFCTYVLILWATARPHFACSIFHVGLAQSANDFFDGKILFNDGKYEDAEEIFTNILNQDTLNDSAAFYLGRISLTKGETDESIQWFKKAIGINDSSSEAYHRMGLAYGLKAQNAGILKKAGLAKNMKKYVEKGESFSFETTLSGKNYARLIPEWQKIGEWALYDNAGEWPILIDEGEKDA